MEQRYIGSPYDAYDPTFGGMVPDNFNDWKVEDFTAKDTIVSDSLFGSHKKKVAARAANSQAAMQAILNSGQKLTPSELQTMQLSADGKLSARDKKIIKQAQRLEAKTDRVGIRAETKQARSLNKSDQSMTQSIPSNSADISQPMASTPMSDAGSSVPTDYSQYVDGTSSNTGVDSSAGSDEPTGTLADTVTLDNVTVTAKRKKDTQKTVMILIGIIILVVAIVYFAPKFLKKK